MVFSNPLYRALYSFFCLRRTFTHHARKMTSMAFKRTLKATKTVNGTRAAGGIFLYESSVFDPLNRPEPSCASFTKESRSTVVMELYGIVKTESMSTLCVRWSIQLSTFI